MLTGALLDLGAKEQLLRERLRPLLLPGQALVVARVRRKGGLALEAHIVDQVTEREDDKVSDAHDFSDWLKNAGFPEKTFRRIQRALEIWNRAREEVSVKKADVRTAEEWKTASEMAAAILCLDLLDIDPVICPFLADGEGMTETAAGEMPVPLPEVLSIAVHENLTFRKICRGGAWVSSDGAAVLAACAAVDTAPEQYRIKKVGIGAGISPGGEAAMLRAMLLEDTAEDVRKDEIYKLECNLDDCSGEMLGYAMERLMGNGALDVCYLPIYMKKNRPAYMLTVLCRIADREKLERILFAETTTIGIRRQRMQRTILKRRLETRDTSLGKVGVKIMETEYGSDLTLEYESVAEIARQNGLPFREVVSRIRKEIDA